MPVKRRLIARPNVEPAKKKNTSGKQDRETVREIIRNTFTDTNKGMELLGWMLSQAEEVLTIDHSDPEDCDHLWQAYKSVDKAKNMLWKWRD